MAPKSSNLGLWVGISVIILMVFAGIAMLIYAVLGILQPAAPEVAVVSATPIVPIIVATLPPTAPPAQQPTQAPPAAATATDSGPLLKIITDANVRTGPGTNYPVIGGLPAGSTPTVVGRDSAAGWYVITYYNSQGWVFGGLAQYTGDINSLPVIVPPPPPPTATPVPPTATPKPAVANTQAAPPPPAGGSQSRGVTGNYFRVRNTSATVNQDIWFEFAVTNTTDKGMYVGGLGAIIPGKFSQASWGDFTLGPHMYLDPEDHLNVSKAGTYTVYLGICWLASRDACEANLNAWELISPGVTITIY